LNWLRSERASLTPAVHVVVNVEVFARLFVVVVVVFVFVVVVIVVVLLLLKRKMSKLKRNLNK
jgi:hypothetical protein